MSLRGRGGDYRMLAVISRPYMLLTYAGFVTSVLEKDNQELSNDFQRGGL
jgi:hypothetical protein